MMYCGAHRLVRLRPDGECRLCTLAVEAASVRKAECCCISGGVPVLWGCPVHKPINDWCHLGAADVGPGTEDGVSFHNWSLERRAEHERNARPRVIIDDHPGYPTVQRALIKNVQHVRYIGDIVGDDFKDTEEERRAADFYDALPEEMRTAIEEFGHRMHNVQHERWYAEDAWLKHGLIGGDVLHDVRGALGRVDWQLKRHFGWGHLQGGERSWYAEKIDRGTRLRGARERVHQPFFSTLAAGVGTSTVHNTVGLFQTPNPNADDVE